ncbi:MAG: type IX secretion system sortase PorU [Vicingaceae bacterium]|nr:type IX secretion system sortase PorU [Vicingaceae bacterium]
MFLKKILSITLLTLLSLSFFAGNIVVEKSIIWNETVQNNTAFLAQKNNSKWLPSFNNIDFIAEKDYLATYYDRILIHQEKLVDINIISINYEIVSLDEVQNMYGFDYLPNDIELTFFNGVEKKVNYGFYNFIPIIYDKNSGTYKKVVNYKFELITEKQLITTKNKSLTLNSVLETGDWYKIGVSKDGVFKLTYDFLKNLGLDIDNINPTNLKIYGNGGKMLPLLNSDYRPDDLQQNAIIVAGESDGVFNKEDFILFYGQSPNTWEFNTSSNLFNYKSNLFSDTSYYFITASNTGQAPKRITSQTSLSGASLSVTTFNDYTIHEKDLINLIKSGQEWYGEIFDIRTNYNFNFNAPNLTLSSPIHVAVSVAARSNNVSTFTVNTNSNSFNISCNGVDINSYTTAFASTGSNTTSFFSTNNIINIGITYNRPNSLSTGWLNKIELNYRRNLSMSGNQLFFRDINSVGIGNIATFNINNSGTVSKIWDISDPFNVKEINFNLTGGTASFSVSTDSLRQFVALTNNYETQVSSLGKVDNQNLHQITQADMIIISHPSFLSQAGQIADLHGDEGLNVIIVTPHQIYNEFSSGSQDIVAIRDFIRMLYNRATVASDLPKYLLLFGDGSYDNKNRLPNNTNFIPTYQSVNSTNPLGTASYVSDDFYGMLDPTEGVWNGPEVMDIAIGRLPVKSQQEANNVVNKILNYNIPSTLDDWRNDIVFVGDDEDSNTHMRQANEIADTIMSQYKSYNVNKILIDAYQQQATPGGNRYPEVNNEIDKAVNNGSLIINYTGHGGEVGWAHERILTVPMINSWENQKGLPLFITATCEFSRFDDPSRTSAGELVLLNRNGGIGLLTTVRTVFSGPNFALNKTLFDIIFTKNNITDKTLGEIFTETKNLTNGGTNNRNFTLLGDPALKLAYPNHQVVTTKLNNINITNIDTIKALQKVTIEGFVQNRSGQKLTNFNGIIKPTVYDKSKQITTLQNDGGNAMQFNLQTSKLFKGKVSVTNGDFSFSFVVPKDISFTYGLGKISYYTENNLDDGHGYFDGFYIGGIADSITADNQGPELELYINDDNFISGGMTDENPSLLAFVEDIHGINMVGNGIGHDIIAILDDKTDQPFILNDFYEADLNSYQKGTIRFPFKELEEGRHKLTLKVWDVYNNSSEATIEFVVVKSKDLVLDKVYNYPNPFTTYTEFWFEHNQPGKPMYAQVQIFTITGKLIQTLEQNILNEGFRSSSITWDGLDSFGDQIGRGVYVYKLRVRAENMSVAEKIQKLVILR